MCCGSGGQCAGSILYIAEKLASFTALTAIVICLIVTMGITLGLGIGLGYNYCFVDFNAVKDTSGNNQNGSDNRLLRSGNNGDEEILDENPSYRRSQATLPPTVPRRTLAMPDIGHTMVIPLHGHLNFPSLIQKLRSRNRNVTLELIT